MNLRNLAILGAVVLGVMAVYVAVSRGGSMTAPGDKAAAERPVRMNYSQLVAARDAGGIQSIEVRNQNVTGELKDGRTFSAVTPLPNTDLVESIRAAGATVEVADTTQRWWVGALVGLLPFILIIGLWIRIMRHMQGGTRGARGFGKSKA